MPSNQTAAGIVEELTQAAREHEELLGITFPEQWFRGQANASWDLEPGVLRAVFLEQAAEHMERLELGDNPDPITSGHLIEKTMNRRFLTSAGTLLSAPDDLVVAYLSAQHYGMPTRLLDWTTLPLVALYFAAQPPDSLAGRVWMFDPEDNYYVDLYHDDSFVRGYTSETPVQDKDEAFAGQLPTLFNDQIAIRNAGILVPIHAPDDVEEGDPQYESLRNGTELVLPIRPTFRFDRMRAQQSCFTFHPPGCGSIETRARSIGVPAELKASVRILLRRMGVSEQTLFPDLDGVARDVGNLLRDHRLSVDSASAILS